MFFYSALRNQNCAHPHTIFFRFELVCAVFQNAFSKRLFQNVLAPFPNASISSRSLLELPIWVFRAMWVCICLQTRAQCVRVSLSRYIEVVLDSTLTPDLPKRDRVKEVTLRAEMGYALHPLKRDGRDAMLCFRAIGGPNGDCSVHVLFSIFAGSARSISPKVSEPTAERTHNSDEGGAAGHRHARPRS